MPRSAWGPFYEQLARAHDYFVGHKAVASQIPDYFDAMIDLLNASEGDHSKQIQAVFDEGVKKYPGFYRIYFTTVAHLLPKWHGDASRIEAFASKAARRSPQGDALYARIYWVVSQWQYRDPLFSRSQVDWPRMSQGFDCVIARYPDQWNVQTCAKFACTANGAKTLAMVLKKVRLPLIEDIWQQDMYDFCKSRAEQPATPPEGSTRV